MINDTIAAISSGLTDSGISIIRISGQNAFNIADSVFRAASGKSFAQIRSYSVSYGHIYDGELLIDEVLLIKMAGPRTYTCEDTVEIDCHGGIIVTRKVLETVLKYGARSAEPGEFTKRAFLNGRIDLSQAEAVIDIINSKNDRALKNSLKQLRGDVKDCIKELREDLLSQTAYIEAALDDPEHISLDGFDDKLLTDLESVRSSLARLIASYDNGRIIKEGVNTVILGKPNAGKSSLLNALMGEERAIVTDIPGTTRDTLEETINLKGITLNIIDTAGIRNTDNIIEKLGVEKALKAADAADLILFVADSTEPADTVLKDIDKYIHDKRFILLLNKSDLSSDHELSEKIALFKSKGLLVLSISALQGRGLDTLSDTIVSLFFSGQLETDDQICITNLRQKELLAKAKASVDKVIESINNGLPEDFYSIDLMDAYTSLGLITGDNVEDDLADKIFSDFCMGK